MSQWHLEHLHAPFAACVLVLLMGGCSEHVKTRGQPAQETRAVHAAKPARLIRATEVARTPEAPAAVLEGACSESDREEHVHDANQGFVNHLRDCSKETWADKTKNVSCLTRAFPSLSRGCAGCFANMASCALDNCKMACMLSSTGSGCTKCANENCQASLIRCTGVARADLP
jgi:hypothetical protein